MFSSLRSLLVVVACLLAATSLTTLSVAQNPCAGTTPCVTTWHNDINRTGWQQHESALSPSTVNQSSFGLLQRWAVTGRVYAQPLIVNSLTTQYTACKPCDLVLVATEEDMLYGFNGTSLSTSAVWSLDLAGHVGGTPVKCGALPSGFTYDPCTSGLLGPYVGVTGTPVIDTSSTNPNTLYVAAAVYFGGANPTIYFYLFAVDITTGQVQGTPVIISGMANGVSPGASGRCTSDFPASGTVTFDYNHIQRSALLLLPSGNVYVAFAPGGGNELRNGWMFAYSFANGTFSQTAKFITTPWGTGGGIWQAGAGPASDSNGAYIYAAVANGTLFDTTIRQNIPSDIGDSLVKLDPSTLAVVDFYAPPDGGYSRCYNDLDFGSGGVLVFPTAFYYDLNTNTHLNLTVNADKESYLYFTNRDDMGKFDASGGNNVQSIQTPPLTQSSPGQGYWGSPAYWFDGTTYWLYYTPTTEDTDSGVAPLALNNYKLLTSGHAGPITSATPNAATGILFCEYSPTPSVSSNGPAGGIVWAIERQNQNNQHGNQHPDCDGAVIAHAALHAFDAATMSEIYSSRALTLTGAVTTFSTPTISNGQVYVGTQTEVDVYGLTQ
jgi:hypothetical protein